MPAGAIGDLGKRILSFKSQPNKGSNKFSSIFKELGSKLKLPKNLGKGSTTKKAGKLKEKEKVGNAEKTEKAKKVKTKAKAVEKNMEDVDEFDFFGGDEEGPVIGEEPSLGDDLDIGDNLGDDFGIGDDLDLGDDFGDDLDIGDNLGYDLDLGDDFGDDFGDDLGDDLDIGEELDFGGAPPQAAAGGGRGPDFTTMRKIEDLEEKLAKLSSTLTTLEQSNTETVDRLKKLDETTMQFLSLYEIVSDQINPFVSDSEKGSAVMERFDHVEERIDKLDGLASTIKRLENRMDSVSDVEQEQLELKFNNIYQTLTEFKEKEEAIDEQYEAMRTELESIKEEIIEEIAKKKEEESRKEEVSRNPVVPTGGMAEVIFETNQVHSTEARLSHVGNDPVKILALIRWIEFLMDKVGRNNFLEALNYYVQIKWISRDVRNQMMEYARGIEHYEDKPEWRLCPEDHKKSLLFIETIRGTDVNMTTIDVIESEIVKLKNVTEGQYGI
ncbi:MAG: FlaD/FlaE family flagellar protein [Halobacteriota archaeon]|nr:FlaD/FlaE family flagellar protein [Halobacteriota archaeon]